MNSSVVVMAETRRRHPSVVLLSSPEAAKHLWQDQRDQDPWFEWNHWQSQQSYHRAALTRASLPVVCQPCQVEQGEGERAGRVSG